MRAARARTASSTRSASERRIAGEAEDREQTVDIDPVGRAVVVAKAAFEFFAGQRETFNQASAAIHAGEAAAAVFEVPGDHFRGECGAAMDVITENGRVGIGGHGVDIVHHQIVQLWAHLKQAQERPVAQQVGNLIPVAHRVQALHGHIFGVVGCLRQRFCAH